MTAPSDRDVLIERYLGVRAATEALAAPLSAEDQMLQSMPECSPTKWHRAHTTWFFETFVLSERHADYATLFNSYYEAIGLRHPRPARGLLSRPTMEEVRSYRRRVDQRMVEKLHAAEHQQLAALQPLIELGIAH